MGNKKRKGIREGGGGLESEGGTWGKKKMEKGKKVIKGGSKKF